MNGERPTRIRQRVVLYAVALAGITYIDRVCISQAAPLITHDLGLTPVQMGYAFSAFAWAYALFEIPSGYMGDRLGPRRVLLRIVTWWSFFTAATGWAWNTTSLVVTRFLFGAGEAGCFPNLTKAFSTWLPPRERARAQGLLWMSARWGGALTPALVAYFLNGNLDLFGVALLPISWRHAFELFGAIGVVWAVFFYRFYRDNPRDHPAMNAAEVALLEGADRLATGHGDVPWMKLVRSRQVFLLSVQYFCLSYGWYFYITWLPTYLKEERGLAIQKGALLAGLPLFLGGLGSVFSGFITPYVARYLGSIAKARRVLAFIGFLAASGFLLLSTRLGNPVAAMLAMGCASFANDLSMPGSWGACMDVGGRFAGTLSGTMNMMGNFGSAVSPIAIGYILAASGGNWNLTFYASAAVYFLGGVCWLFLDPVTPLEA
jgi:MFS family permease